MCSKISLYKQKRLQCHHVKHYRQPKETLQMRLRKIQYLLSMLMHVFNAENMI